MFYIDKKLKTEKKVQTKISTKLNEKPEERKDKNIHFETFGKAFF